MVALVYLVWRTLKMMPRTKPQQVKPESSSSIGWDDVAGCEEAKHELREVVEFLRDPGPLQAARRERCRRASCCTARPAPARRCSRRRSPASPAPTSSASRRARSSRCSPASARPASAACSRSRRSTRPAIIFIDELDAIGLQARLRHLAREGPDAQPAAGRDGRLRGPRRPDRDRRLEPRRRPRPGAAAPGPLRPPGAGRRRRTSTGREQILQVHTRNKPRRGRRPRAWSRAGPRASPAPTSRTSATRRRSSPAAKARDDHRAADFDGALERVVAGLQTRRVITPGREAGDRLPRGRPRARLASCCPRCRRCTRSRSFRAGGRSATR